MNIPPRPFSWGTSDALPTPRTRKAGLCRPKRPRTPLKASQDLQLLSLAFREAKGPSAINEEKIRGPLAELYSSIQDAPAPQGFEPLLSSGSKLDSIDETGSQASEGNQNSTLKETLPLRPCLARQLRSSPRLTDDLSLLSDALKQLPKVTDTSPTAKPTRRLSLAIATNNHYSSGGKAKAVIVEAPKGADDSEEMLAPLIVNLASTSARARIPPRLKEPPRPPLPAFLRPRVKLHEEHFDNSREWVESEDRTFQLSSAKSRYDNVLDGMQLHKKMAATPLHTRMVSLADQLRVPLDILTQAFEVFEEVCGQNMEKSKKKKEAELRIDIFKDGEINADGFAKVLCKLTGASDPKALPEGLVYRSFMDADQNQSQTVGFLEFALWYSRHGFLENMLLSDDQRQIRAVARKYNMSLLEVEHYKEKFDHYDDDGSGEIEYPEFEKLIIALFKVPANCELPKSRIKQFWQEADANGGGSISFEEFLVFYNRYFNTVGVCESPFEEYYRAIRRVKVKRLN